MKTPDSMNTKQAAKGSKQMSNSHSKPQVLARHVAAQTHLFKIESVELAFQSGEKRTYERLVPGGAGAVMVVAITDQQEIILVREYAVGVEDYVLTLPGGKIDLGESAAVAANRELIEEVGFGANHIEILRKINLNPRYASSGLNIALAYGLYPDNSLEGDEPEPLEIVKWPLDDLDALLWREDFNEGRAMAGVIIAAQRYQQTKTK